MTINKINTHTDKKNYPIYNPHDEVPETYI